MQSIELYEDICRDLLKGEDSLKAYKNFYVRKNNIGFPRKEGSCSGILYKIYLFFR